MIVTQPIKTRDCGQRDLDRVVAGITTFTTDFDGPASSWIGCERYQILCSHGLKEQGDVAPCYEYEQAIRMFAAELTTLIEENPDCQLAWRIRPEFRIDEKAFDTPRRFSVYSRLAFLPTSRGSD